MKATKIQMKRSVSTSAKRPLSDFISELASTAKDFATEMTSVNVERKGLHDQTDIEREYVDNTSVVCNMLIQRGIHSETLRQVWL